MIQDSLLLNDYQAGVYDGLRIRSREGSHGVANCYLLICLNPGCTRIQMAEATELEQLTVGFHTKRLLECGFIREQKVGRVIHYFPNHRANKVFPDNNPLTRRKKELMEEK